MHYRAVGMSENSGRGSKGWKMTTEDFKVILVVEFSFVLMF
jgi:hypothetical protein